MPMLKSKKAIIFDFDDTLVEYKPIYLKTHLEAAKELNLRIPTEKELLDLAGLPWKRVLSKLWPGINQEAFQEICHRIASTMERKAIPGSKEFVNYLLTTPRRLYILSSRYRESILMVMKKAQFPTQPFTQIIGSDINHHHKPDPKVFNILLKEYDKEDLVYIGDSLAELQAAKNAGITFIGLLAGNSNREAFEKFGAEKVVDNFEQLKNLL